jgi:hypothetical protein
MSSVTRFLRQVPVSAGFVNPDTITSAALDFVPASGNYVGNYPPGYVVPAVATGLSTALSNAKLGNAQLILRDMGKTIQCQYVATVGASLTSAPTGFFREYQLLVVSPISASQLYIGGTSGNTFGVAGPAPATTGGTSTYLTFYLPSVVAGVGSAVAAALPVVYNTPGGQL